MKAADVMTRQVVTVRPNATIEAAARLMLKHRIRSKRGASSASSAAPI